MPQLRLNVATKEWVVVATERAKRPEEFCRPGQPPTDKLSVYRSDCPFCPGNEGSEPELLRYRDEQGQWQVRVVPNKYPALAPAESPDPDGELMGRHMPGVGHHEVIIDSPVHNTGLALVPHQNLVLLLKAWRERYGALVRLTESAHVVLFKNHGERAGTSLQHPHCQAVSLPVLPAQVRRRLEEAMRFYNDFGECVYCRMLRFEQQQQVRLVSQGQGFTAFIPYAAYSPFHLWLVPHHHACCFSAMTDAEIEDLAAVLQDTLARYYHGLNDPDYNLVLQSAKPRYVGAAFWHWYISLVPRLGHAAGFELGTGMFINTSTPEADAAFLREVALP